MEMALTGDDSILINGNILTDFADGDVGAFTFPDKLVESKIGKNGNALFAFNAMGLRSEATLRTILGSPTDKYLNSLQKAYINDPASFTALGAEFIKRVGDGKGNVTNVSYTFAGGMLPNIPEAKENVAGETEQAVAIWKLTFANTDRALG